MTTGEKPEQEAGTETLDVSDTDLAPQVRETLVSLMEEVDALRRALAEAQSRMGELERLADHDPLLPIYNRRAFVRELDRALAMIERYGMKASLIFIDVNGLKAINDSRGHAAGDAALAHVSATLMKNLRATDALGRLGGDEFGILLTQADQQTAERKAAQLAEAVSAERVVWKDGGFTTNVSCGVIEIGDGVTASEAIERADNAMYAVKAAKAGR